MSISCDLILDLPPKFWHNLCSESTEAFITEHLGTCKKCYHALIKMDAEIDIPEYEVGSAIARKRIIFSTSWAADGTNAWVLDEDGNVIEKLPYFYQLFPSNWDMPGEP